MTPETDSNSLKIPRMRCYISRREPVQVLPGFITAWDCTCFTVLMAPGTGLRLNEEVSFRMESGPSYPTDGPACSERLQSRVASVVWRSAGDLIGLAIRGWELPEARAASKAKPVLWKSVS